MSELLVQIVDIVWGLPLVILLTGGGVLLAITSQFRVLRGFIHAWKLILGKFHHKSESEAPGQLSHFRALANALSGTIGMGNIAGVAVAISQGGPGAVFWMWCAALIGMNTKFFECTLAILYRGKDHEGNIQGGPMYTITQGLPKKFHFMGYFFALAGLVGTLSLFNSNQLTSFMGEHYSTNNTIVGVFLTIFVAYILLGGVRRISDYTSKLVPVMCVVYALGALGIIIMNADKVLPVLSLIVESAFSGKAAFGGAVGLGIVQVFKIGIKRATFSNEAGIGTAPMAHGDAKTSEPIAEGLVAMVGPFIDTLVICTMTALVILIGVENPSELGLTGVLLTQKAFTNVYGSFGTHLLGVAILLFSFSTILGMANYNQKCWNFLFKGKSWFGSRYAFVFYYSVTVFIGCISTPKDVINIIDIGLALMAIPNMLATIYLSPKVMRLLKKYFKEYL